MYMNIDAYILNVTQKTFVSLSLKDNSIWFCTIEFRTHFLPWFTQKTQSYYICQDTQVFL